MSHNISGKQSNKEAIKVSYDAMFTWLLTLRQCSHVESPRRHTNDPKFRFSTLINKKYIKIIIIIIWNNGTMTF